MIEAIAPNTMARATTLPMKPMWKVENIVSKAMTVPLERFTFLGSTIARIRVGMMKIASALAKAIATTRV